MAHADHRGNNPDSAAVYCPCKLQEECLSTLEQMLVFFYNGGARKRGYQI